MNKVVQSEAETTVDLKRFGQAARVASKILANAPTDQKNESLRAMAKTLRARSDTILRENAIDLEFGARDGLQGPLLDRLELTPDRVNAMADGLTQVAGLPDSGQAIQYYIILISDWREHLVTSTVETPAAGPRQKILLAPVAGSAARGGRSTGEITR